MEIKNGIFKLYHQEYPEVKWGLLAALLWQVPGIRWQMTLHLQFLLYLEMRFLLSQKCVFVWRIHLPLLHLHLHFRWFVALSAEVNISTYKDFNTEYIY